MTAHDEVLAGIDRLETHERKPGEFLVIHTEGHADAVLIGRLASWVRERLPDTPVLLAAPGTDVSTVAASALGLQLWGSDCDSCGNTTPDSMVCDACGSDQHTRRLWIEQ